MSTQIVTRAVTLGKSSKLFTKRFAEELAEFKSHGGSAADFAKKVGIARDMLYRYLGGAVPDLDSVEQIAERLGYSFIEFLGGGDHPLTECYRRAILKLKEPGAREAKLPSVEDILDLVRSHLEGGDGSVFRAMVEETLAASKKPKGR